MFLELITKLLRLMKIFKPNYKIVSIYADPVDNLYIIPNSEKPMRGVKGGTIAEMDELEYLGFPYTDEALEKVINTAFERCHKYVPEWPNGLGPLERYLNVKRYEKAVIDKRYVCVQWNKNDGYCVIPTKKIPKQGYIYQEEKTIFIGKTITKGSLATALKRALDVATKWA
jgi:hypothetical protein